MIQKSSACELGRGEQGLGLKIVIVRGLSWCFCTNRQQSLGPGTGAGQGGGCCSENLAVQTPERAELHFREKSKIWGVAETWVCRMQPVWGHSPHRVSCSVSMAAALFPLAFAGGKGTALKIIAQFLILSRIRFTYSAWEGCCVLPTWGCKTHFLGGIHTCAHSFSGSAISCVRPQPKKTREASTPARGICLNRHKLNDVPI